MTCHPRKETVKKKCASGRRRCLGFGFGQRSCLSDARGTPLGRQTERGSYKGFRLSERLQAAATARSRDEAVGGERTARGRVRSVGTSRAARRRSVDGAHGAEAAPARGIRWPTRPRVAARTCGRAQPRRVAMWPPPEAGKHGCDNGTRV